jgi:hypothetical protein
MMKPKVDPGEYQTVIDGKTLMVNELTIEQLQQELCYAMDTINMTQEGMCGILEKINHWHKGKW